MPMTIPPLPPSPPPPAPIPDAAADACGTSVSARQGPTRLSASGVAFAAAVSAPSPAPRRCRPPTTVRRCPPGRARRRPAPRRPYCRRRQVARRPRRRRRRRQRRRSALARLLPLRGSGARGNRANLIACHGLQFEGAVQVGSALFCRSPLVDVATGEHRNRCTSAALGAHRCAGSESPCGCGNRRRAPKVAWEPIADGAVRGGMPTRRHGAWNTHQNTLAA